MILKTDMLCASVVVTLMTPSIVALLLGMSYFFKRELFVHEKWTYRLVRFSSVFSWCASIVALLAWCIDGRTSETATLAQFELGSQLKISLALFFTWLNLSFLATCTTITLAITFFSHRYLHRDPGYRRFFITISLFSFGINLIILAGNFDLIFAGWEMVGLSSFLLIAYFWHRPKAVAAATRAYYIFRVCDLGLLVSILITHFFWHDLSIFNDLSLKGDSVLSHVPIAWRWLLSVAILLPVLGKSAQFPFCFWLPKAMEGPTHSSAIFYGSVSIHVGVFLLIRTMPLWYFTPGFNYLLATIGIVTAIAATLCAQVQSTIKGQIGYASIAQVGLMLVELSFGLMTLAFIHLVGNAFLRCFQLLVSSSILTTHLHMQTVVRSFGSLSKFGLGQLFPRRYRESLYVFAINDGFFEAKLNKWLIKPTMILAAYCNKLANGGWPRAMSHARARTSDFSQRSNSSLHSFVPMLFVFSTGIFLDVLFRSYAVIGLVSLITALFMALASLGEKRHAMFALMLAIFANLFAFLSVTSSRAGLIYLIGFVTSASVAVEALRYIQIRRTITDLKNFSGLYQQFPLAGTMLLIGSLGIVSFPISSTFFGEDLLLGLSIKSGLHFLIILQLVFILSGNAVIRLYALVMYGRRDNAMPDLKLDMHLFPTFLRLLFFVAGNVLAFTLVIG